MSAHLASDAPSIDREVHIDSHGAILTGNLGIPADAKGVVLFAHGSGSGRFSSRNRFVAQKLRQDSLGTLLLDLLTEAEERFDDRTAKLRFNIPLLAERLCDVIDWLMHSPQTQNLSIGLFGASTGGGAALLAAARVPQRVRAVVSRGGRPDLAGEALDRVACPTLLIVGGEDDVVIDLNRQALAHLRCPTKELVIVPGAGHLFEEPGALEEVADLSSNWFTRYLGAVAAASV